MTLRPNAKKRIERRPLRSAPEFVIEDLPQLPVEALRLRLPRPSSPSTLRQWPRVQPAQEALRLAQL